MEQARGFSWVPDPTVPDDDLAFVALATNGERLAVCDASHLRFGPLDLVQAWISGELVKRGWTEVQIEPAVP